jgi:hypothetical protein
VRERDVKPCQSKGQLKQHRDVLKRLMRIKIYRLKATPFH